MEASGALEPVGIEKPARRHDEQTFQNWIKDTVTRAGWLYYHVQDSRAADEGWPDVVAIYVHGATVSLIIAELKSATGKLSPGQRLWLHALWLLANAVDADRRFIGIYVWRAWSDVRTVVSVAHTRQHGQQWAPDRPWDQAVREYGLWLVRKRAGQDRRRLLAGLSGVAGVTNKRRGGRWPVNRRWGAK